MSDIRSSSHNSFLCWWGLFSSSCDLFDGFCPLFDLFALAHHFSKKLVNWENLGLLFNCASQEDMIGRNLIFMTIDLGRASQVLSTDRSTQLLHFQSMIHNLNGIVEVLDLWCLVNNSHDQNKKLFTKNSLNGKVGLISTNSCAIAQNCKETQTLSHSFVIIGAKQAT